MLLDIPRINYRILVVNPILCMPVLVLYNRFGRRESQPILTTALGCAFLLIMSVIVRLKILRLDCDMIHRGTTCRIDIKCIYVHTYLVAACLRGGGPPLFPLPEAIDRAAPEAIVKKL